mmetsp:Transcript_24064/g.55582  ORF Transcript_24064/g.55582 Transcript_24064/m.55582 type:complete len:368 (+) Transcript_24064:41-1144(+)
MVKEYELVHIQSQLLDEEDKRNCLHNVLCKPRVLATIVAAVVVAVGLLAARFVNNTGADDVVTAAYVATQAITTIGYGDLPVQSEATRLGMAFYMLGVIIVAAYAVRLLTEYTLSRHRVRLRKHARHLYSQTAMDNGTLDYTQVEMQANKYEERCELASALLLFCLSILFGSVFYRLHEHCTCGYGLEWRQASLDHKMCPEYAKAGPWAFGITIDYATCSEAGGWTKSTVDTIYMSVITVTTVGFGDFSPRSFTGRMIAVPWMFGGVFAAALFLSKFSLVLFGGVDQTEGLELGMYKNTAVSKLLFDSMDVDRNSTISRYEFLRFMVVQNELVDERTVLKVDEIFDRLDARKRNSITWDDFILGDES